jgi:hypothetical protein
LWEAVKEELAVLLPDVTPTVYVKKSAKSIQEYYNQFLVMFASTQIDRKKIGKSFYEGLPES